MKRFSSILLIIFVVGVFYLYGQYSSAIHYSLNSEETRVIVDIEKGMMGSEVADLLYEKGLIKSPTVFGYYLRQKNALDQIKAGRIVLQTNFTLPDIVEALVSGKTEEMPVTLLEGWTAQQMADYLEESGFTTAESFMNCIETCKFDFPLLPEGYVEGYLYPDTYFVDPVTYDDDAFITRLINTFMSRIQHDEELSKGLLRSDIPFSDMVIMASIVEREERDPAERATVAGILWNRYHENAGLGADATVLYALGRTKGGLTYQDLQIDSPYNTRKYRGLPPTPICNPSISSLRAAMYPNETDYWYYLHDNEGGIHYARTLEEHNKNKALYIN